MRIAIMADAAMPFDTRNHGRMMHQLGVEFCNRGHDVVIITPATAYQAKPLKVDEIDGIEIWRFKSGNTRAVSTEKISGLILRTVNEWLIPWRGWYAISDRVKNEPFDLCVIHSPSIFFGGLAKKLKIHGAYIYVVLRDMFPQWAVDQGLIKKKSPVELFFRYYERLIYKTANCIGVMSENNVGVLKNTYPALPNIKVLMNWIENEPLEAKFKTSKFIDQLNLKSKVILFYGGNIGNAQDMTNIMRLAKNLLGLPQAHILILGQGDEFNLINEIRNSWKLENVTILPAVPQFEFRQILSSIDIGLFSLAIKHTTHNFPGKVLGYMLESVPILGSVNPGNDLCELVNNFNAGFVHIKGEDELLLESAKRLILDTALRKKLGSNAKVMLGKHFSIDAAADSILHEYKSGG